MAYVANDIGTIPASGFDWYVIFFEGIFANELRRELEDNFLILGQKVGRNILVVRGFDPEKFHDSTYEAFEIQEQKPKWLNQLIVPALMVTNTTPVEMMKSAVQMEKAKVMIFPLENIYKERGSITGFLGDLLKALRGREAYDALENLDETLLEKNWGWLTKYFSMNPGFFGFGVKLDRVIDKIIFKRKPQKAFA